VLQPVSVERTPLLAELTVSKTAGSVFVLLYTHLSWYVGSVGIVRDTAAGYDQQSAVTVISEQAKAGCEIADRHRPVWGLESSRLWTPWPLTDAYIRWLCSGLQCIRPESLAAFSNRVSCGEKQQMCGSHGYRLIIASNTTDLLLKNLTNKCTFY